MEEKPKILDLGDFEVLVYEGPQGLRVESWKYPTTVEGGVLVEHEIEAPTTKLQRRRFRSEAELREALLKEVRPVSRSI